MTARITMSLSDDTDSEMLKPNPRFEGYFRHEKDFGSLCACDPPLVFQE